MDRRRWKMKMILDEVEELVEVEVWEEVEEVKEGV